MRLASSSVLRCRAPGCPADLNIDFLDIFVKLLLSFFVPTVIGKVHCLHAEQPGPRVQPDSRAPAPQLFVHA
jgi:hypothetical protein